MSGGSRSLPVRPSLRYLKLAAKRRLAAGEFATLHDAQAAIAREHGLPSWAGLKQACAYRSEPGDHRVGLGWLLPPDGETAVHSGVGLEATAFLRIRLRDGRTHVVLTSRAITLDTVDGRLLSSWTNPATHR
jgi:hypothetical protein